MIKDISLRNIFNLFPELYEPQMLSFLNMPTEDEKAQDHLINLIYELSRFIERQNTLKNWKPHKSLSNLSKKIETFVEENKLNYNRYKILIDKSVNLYRSNLKKEIKPRDFYYVGSLEYYQFSETKIIELKTEIYKMLFQYCIKRNSLADHNISNLYLYSFGKNKYKKLLEQIPEQYQFNKEEFQNIIKNNLEAHFYD